MINNKLDMLLIRIDSFVNKQAMMVVVKEVGADVVAHGCTGNGNDQAHSKILFSTITILFCQQKRD